MDTIENRKSPQIPGRFTMPKAWMFGLYVLFLAFILWSFNRVGISISDLVSGVPHMGRIVSEMVPPNVGRIQRMSISILETFQIALVGSVIGIAVQFFLAQCSHLNLTLHTRYSTT
jgi:phosphonate transport system permease protein